MEALGRDRFDELVVAPLASTSDMKRGLLAHHATVDAVVSPRLHAAGQGLVVLLRDMPRKTSPLHLRMVHALCALYQEARSSEDGELLIELLNETARMMRRGDLQVKP